MNTRHLVLDVLDDRCAAAAADAYRDSLGGIGRFCRIVASTGFDFAGH